MIPMYLLSCGLVWLTATPVPPPGIVSARSPDRLQPAVPEGHVSLNGQWLFRLDPEDVGERQQWFGDALPEPGDWGDIWVPGTWQAQGYGLDYHGVGWYRRTFEVPQEHEGRRVWLRFAGVATSARVWVNGQPVGEHIGNWAPFVLCISDSVRSDRPNVLAVRVEELPRHFSAGFARVPGLLGQKDGHFGGLWQEVSWYSTRAVHLDDVFVSPALAAGQAHVEASVSWTDPVAGRLVCALLDPEGRQVARGEDAWSTSSGSDGSRTLRLTLPVPEPRPWSPETPDLYTARVEAWESGTLSDTRSVLFGMRDVTRREHQILLNGEPLYVRGMLHWGYYPHLFSIDPSEAQILREFADLREAGFNLVKVCLFLFPRRFYELADETGMLIWQEYPTWQTMPTKDDEGPFDGIVREYAEWHRSDRNHPSVILRSLTCEAEDPHPGLIEQLFSQAKEMTKGGLVADNSAYMNQVQTDWYDAHMYLDLDDYHTHLVGLSERLRNKPEIKPYMSGEEMDCDTYRDMDAVRRAWIKGGRVPWWLDNANFQLQERVERELVERHGADVPAEFVRRQNRHALVTRKGYIEDFRRYPEFAGYVVCGIRDIPVTRPGFYDDLLEPKWRSDEWLPFTGERVLVLESPRRSHCFRMDEAIDLPILLSNFGEPLDNVPVNWQLTDGTEVLAQGEGKVTVARGTIVKAERCTLAAGKTWPTPRKLALSAQLGPQGDVTRNAWPVWVFPVRGDRNKEVYAYSEADDDTLAHLLGPGTVTVRPAPGGSGWVTMGSQPVEFNSSPSAVLVTDSLAAPVLDALSEGARVIYLADGRHDYLPRTFAPFWRETAIWLPTGHPVLGDFSHEGFVDWQFYDMTQRRAFDTSAFRSEIHPLIWGVNSRFAEARLMVDYVFEARVGRGGLLASCLNVAGSDNVAGRYLLDCFINYAASGRFLDAADPEIGKLLESIRHSNPGS